MQKKDKKIPSLLLRKAAGFSLVEIMIVTFLVSAITGGIYLIFSSGQASWFTADANIQNQDNLRKSLQRISAELRQSKADKKYIFDGTGVNGTDILRFSIPILCQAGSTFIDSDGNIPYWGGPLTWGCSSLTCMDADQNCTTLEYKYIEYFVDNNQQLRREILTEGLNVVHGDVFAVHISDFQVTVNGNMIHIMAKAQKETMPNRLLTSQADIDIYLRN